MPPTVVTRTLVPISSLICHSFGQSQAEAVFEGGKWGDRPQAPLFRLKKNCCPQTGKIFMSNEKTKFVRQVAKVDLV